MTPQRIPVAAWALIDAARDMTERWPVASTEDRRALFDALELAADELAGELRAAAVNRGRCPICGRTVRLRKDGRVGPHDSPGAWPPARCAGWMCRPAQVSA